MASDVNMSADTYPAIIRFILCCLVLSYGVDAAIVTSINPQEGSSYGGMPLTIYGNGFAKNQFNFGAGYEHLGNSVLMISSTRSYECEMHKDGCTETQIICYTKAMEIDDYYVRVTVDGVPIPADDHCRAAASRCRFRPSDNRTPHLSEISPRTATPGGLITMRGKLMTSRLGSHEAASSNGREEKILRVYFGGQKCELIEDFDLSIPYHIELDNEGSSDYGEMTCLTKGTYVSNINGSFLIEAPFGRSYPDGSVLKVFADNSIAMMQTYAVVDSVTPSEGSLAGGLQLTIDGQYFDDTDKPMNVHIADTKCEVESFTSERIICRTAAKSGLSPPYKGGRGVDHVTWDESLTNLDELSALQNNSVGVVSQLDTLYLSYNSSASSLTRGLLVLPRDGEYTFELSGQACMSRLYLSLDNHPENKSLVVSRQFSSWGSYHHNTRYSLTAGQEYYVELQHTSTSNTDNKLQLAIRMYNTDKTASQTGSAVNEKQKLVMSSTIVPETQVIDLSGLTSQSSVTEVQTIDVVPATPDYVTNFRLGVDGVFSDWLSVSTVDSAVTNALNSLPTIAPDTVTTTRSDVTGGYRYTVTFNSERGQIPLIEYIAQEPGAVTITVQRVRAGTPSNSFAVLEMDGIPSKPIAVSASAAQVKAVMEDLYSVRCSSFITEPSDAEHSEDFESATGYESNLGGWISTDRYPMCGRKSLLNPAYFVKRSHTNAFNVAGTPYICFGYSGFLNPYIAYNFSYIEDNEIKSARRWFNMELPPYDGDFEWHYTCVDMKSHIENAYPNGKYFLVNAIQVSRDGLRDTFIDNVYVGKRIISEDNLAGVRSLPPREYLMYDITVTSDTAGVFTVNMYPVNCSYPFSVMKSRSSSAVNIQRVTEASPPVTGTFDISYGGQGIRGIPSGVAEDKLQSLLETLPGMGGLIVKRTGLCHSYQWSIDWLQVGGDRPDIIIDSSNVHGIDAVITGEKVRDGYLEFKPLIGDMVFRTSNTPQVNVEINGIPSACSGSCDFTWTNQSTPEIFSISPDSGSGIETITIEGANLDSSAVVNVGSSICTISAITANQIVCDLDLARRGVHQVNVNVDGKGLAVGNFTYEFVTQVDTIEPANGHLSGGYAVTLVGSGLTAEDITIRHPKGGCEIISSNDTSITCILQPSDSSTSGLVDFMLYFSDDTNLTVTDAFEFDNSTSLSIISSINTSTASVNGDTVMDISGSGFGASASEVHIGYSNLAEVLSWSDTAISLKLPALAVGSYPLLVVVDDGYADTSRNVIPMISYQLEVSDIHPRLTSKYGSMRHLISGVGFGDDADLVSVKLGEVNCEVISLTDTEIVCVTQSTSKTHKIDNSGSHAAYGQYYAWNPPLLKVEVGDVVEWSWMTPLGVSDVKYTIQQTDDIDSKSPTENGFGRIKPPTSAGSYSYQFTEEGMFYYWSGPINPSGSLVIRGAVEVLAKQPWSSDLSVAVNGQSAAINLSQTRQKRQLFKRETCVPEELSCTYNNSGYPINSCEEDNVVITDISPNNGTSQQVITFTGSGFSVSDCNNVVKFGDIPCTVISSSVSEVQCQLDVSGQSLVEPGVILPASMIVNNLGTAVLSVTGEWYKGFSLVPSIGQLSHSSGSLAGGHELIIHGIGFTTKERTAVKIGFSQCDIQSMNFTQITCLTSPSAVWSGDITVDTLTLQNEVLTAECLGDCSYSYSGASTPLLSSLSPNTVETSSTDLVLTGTLFGNDPAGVTVTAAGVDCVVSSVTDSEITCTIGSVPAGSHLLNVVIASYGQPGKSPKILTSKALINSITPSSGSIHGGLMVTISGNGFDEDTVVSLGGSACQVQTVAGDELVCETAAHTVEDVSVSATAADGTTYDTTQTFTYSQSSTPTVSSVTPNTASSGDTIAVIGTGFTAVSKVMTGSIECTTSSSTETQIDCILGNHAAALVDLIVHVSDKGNSAATPFTFTLAVDAVTPTTGSFGGGQLLTIEGAGFDESVSVSICGEKCVNKNVTSSQVICRTPAADSSSGSDLACSVVVILGSLEVEKTNAYTYTASLTASLISIFPLRGGTAGGTTLTITGSSLDVASVSVSIGGVDCSVQSSSDAAIVCMTGAQSKTGKYLVEVSLGDNGLAVSDLEFHYVDVWSSLYTWGGGPLPEEGDLVVIPKGQTLLLDMDTPVLKVLLIQGGNLIFDDKDVELQAENILITDGGRLQVGTEEEPFQHKGIITLHGHLRSLEMPIYGAKTLGVRNGTLDLHGIPRKPWTKLAATANAGDTEIVLEQAVDWQPGDHIVIASTGGRHSQRENEELEILAVSGDGLTLTLNQSLEYNHLGITADIGGGHLLEMRAEVGLLTHNVVVRGSINHQWDETIPACAAGFDTGEFATQTCFQGRFGEEMGSDEFGGAIMMHAPEPDVQWVVGRLSYIEVTHAGQAFRLGRYPIHFHLNGHMNQSYVRGCSIHRTFNRAINVHNTHDVLVEHNVIYHVMGGAVFLEDSAETGNILQYNLAVFVIPSTSLLNDDITPAAFWVTHPSNIVRHNHAAGGSHFGFWYRMHTHPMGPSADSSLCPKNAPLGEFSNNTAHSLGWFGLWTFDDYFPMDGNGICSQRTKAIPAVFESLTAWHCEKGAEFVNAGNIQFDRFLMVNNVHAGIEGKINLQHDVYSYDGPLVKNSVIVSGTGGVSGGCTGRGIILPFSAGFMVIDTEFVGFNTNGCAGLGVTSITGKCSFGCGGYTYKFEGITWTDSTNKAAFRWEHEAALEDLDGTLTGISGAKVVPYNPTLDPAVCTIVGEWSGGIDGAICDTQMPFHRYAWNNPTPSSLMFKNVALSTEYGTSVVPFLKKRLTHIEGWMCMMMGHSTYELTYINGGQFVNTSSTGTFYNFNDTDYLIIETPLYQKPDRLFLVGDSRNMSENELTYEDNIHGDYHISDNLTLSYIVSGKKTRAKRSLGYSTNLNVNFRAYVCYFNDCIPPPDPNQVPPPLNRPDDALFWSQDVTWETAEEGWGGNNGDGTFSPPKANTNVKIRNEDWVVLDTQPAVLNELIIYGVLEFEFAQIEGKYMDFTLSVTHIFLHGGRLFIGWEDNPMRGNVDIILRGDWSTEEMYLPYGGPTIGAKAIGVFGSLDMHGLPREVYWTKLAAPASAGDSQITLKEPVDWVAGEEIIITASGKSAWESDKRKITAVSADKLTLTLNESLTFNHFAGQYTYGDYSLEISTEVGLLTRNVRVIGEDYSDLQTQSFGGRIIVGDFFDGNQQWTGFARIENVEFYHCGQEGYIDDYDPRFAVSYLNTGEVSAVKPSYLRKNSFVDSFNTAIGLFNTPGLSVEDNVVHGTVEAGIRVYGSGASLIHNLVSFTMTRSCYQERVETMSFFNHASIEVFEAEDLNMHNNTVAGSERGGYAVSGIVCGSTGNWTNNVAHSALIGVFSLPEFTKSPPGCSQISGFTAYNCHDFGIYSQRSTTTVVTDNVLAENGVGVMVLVYGDSAVGHVQSDKKVIIKDSLVVGRTSSSSCSYDFSTDPDTCNLDLSTNLRSWSSPSNGNIGVAFGQFMSSFNGAPFKPWKGLKSYNSISGLTEVQNVVFASFGLVCGSSRDYVLSTSPSNEDGQHPVELTGVSLLDVADESKLFFHRPLVSKINSADCVDMDCDAKKKCMVKDLDGSFLEAGSGAAALPQSEWEWNGDPRRGLGDYRIPKTLLTDLEGNRLAVSSVAPYKGVTDNQNCTWMPDWTAYKCTKGKNYEMLIIESMDSDTETRRLSPVAVLGEKYIDLINGPQDHGWCSGYTCRKRVSTFMALVATDTHYALYFTSTSPQHLRLTMLNSGVQEKITLEIYYSISNRIDVYVDGIYRAPKNTEQVDGKMKYLIPDYHCQYCPQLSDSHGTNFQNRWEQLMYVAVSGLSPVDIKMTDLIMLTFDLVMTEDEFFGEQIVNNLAIFFGIPEDKIRVVNVISENTQLSSAKRKKRALDTGHIIVQFEIGDAPTLSINDTVTNGMTYEELESLRNQIIDSAQSGVLATELALPYDKVYVSIPLPNPDDPAWGEISENAESYSVEIRIPNNLKIYSHPSIGSEGESLKNISIQLLNDKGEPVTQFGTQDWEVTVSLSGGSNSQAKLLGTTTVVFTAGWANFTDLTIDRYGTGYVLEYTISTPTNMTHLKVTSEPLDIYKRELDAIIYTPESVTEGQEFRVSVSIIDKQSGEPASQLDWNGLIFSAKLSLNPIVKYTDGSLISSPEAVFNPINGLASIFPVKLIGNNAYVLDLAVKSSPDNSYGFTAISDPIVVYPFGRVATGADTTKQVSLDFDGSMTNVGEGNDEYFEVTVFNYILHKYQNVSLGSVSCDDDLKCEFSVSGTDEAVDDVVYDIIESSFSNPLLVEFMNNTYDLKDVYINGHLATQAQDDQPETADRSFPMWAIGVILGVALLLLGIVIAVAVIASKNKKLNKIDQSRTSLGSASLELTDFESGAPPTSTKVPRLEEETRKIELSRLNDRLKAKGSEPLPPIKTKVEPPAVNNIPNYLPSPRSPPADQPETQPKQRRWRY